MSEQSHKSGQREFFESFRPNVPRRIFQRVKQFHADNAKKLLSGPFPPLQRVLYVACGDGTEIELLGPGIGIDISVQCAHEVAQRGFPGLAGDVEHLPFADKTFDLVYCNSFHHFFDFSAAFRELYRVCRPGGRILLGPECHRWSLDAYVYNTVLGYWKTEKGMLSLTPGLLKNLFAHSGMTGVTWFHGGNDLIGAVPGIRHLHDLLRRFLPRCFFFWGHFYISGIKPATDQSPGLTPPSSFSKPIELV